jgi:cytochrome b561
MSAEVKRYHPALIALHWLLALAIIGMFAFGSFVLDDMENTEPGKASLLSLHLIGGIVILALTVVRLVVRIAKSRPAPMPGSRGAQMLSTGIQHLSYTLTVLIVVSGLMLAFKADLFAILFSHTGTLPKDFEDYSAHEVHGYLADALMAVVALHVAGALKHQLVLKNNIMSRMSLFAKD